MKILLFILMIVGITSCVEVPEDTPTNSNKVEYVFTKNGMNPMQALEFSYKGHSYIWFHKSGGWDGNDGIVHNPDCPCNK